MYRRLQSYAREYDKRISEGANSWQEGGLQPPRSPNKIIIWW